MNKFLKILKIVVLVWGAISLTLIVSLVIWGLIVSRPGHRTSEKPQDTVYEKQLDEMNVKVVQKISDNSDDVLVSLTRAGRPIVSNYHLPVKKYHIEYPRFHDAAILFGNERDYRLVLYSSDDYEDESTDQVWVLKGNNRMELVEMVEMGGMHKIDGDETILLGNKHVALPYYGDFAYVRFVIPVEVRIGNAITVSPLVNQNGVELMKQVFDREAQKRLEKLRKSPDADMLKRHEDAMRKFSEVIAEKNISY